MMSGFKKMRIAVTEIMTAALFSLYWSSPRQAVENWTSCRTWSGM